MSLRGEGVGIFLCLNSLPNKCLPKFDRRFQLCRQPPLRGCCSAVQCSVRIVSQLRPALENFLVGYYAHQTQMCEAFSLYFGLLDLQGVPKKMSFSGKTAITTFKLIQDANVGGVLENSGYLLQHGH